MIQLLWVNLVMDAFAALAFGGEPALARYMDERPIKRAEAFVTKKMWSAILINGMFLSGLATLFLTFPQIKYLSFKFINASFFTRNQSIVFSHEL